MKRVLIFGLALLLFSCAQRSQFERIEFRAPSLPDAALQPYLEGVERMGIVCVTNIEPFRELDVEKVMALLSNASPSEAASQERWIFPTPMCRDEVDLTSGSECLSISCP